jgi:hypothetical protein
MGKKAPQCLEHLGTVLSLLDQAGSCFWGCGKGDHIVEYMAGHASSTSRAALRLLYFAFYDQSLMLTRSLYEMANLLFLFMMEPDALEEWKRRPGNERMKHFSPFKVRLRLEARKIPQPVDRARYSRLSELAVHITPQIRPQGHNPLGVPTAGAYFQEAGVLISLNELAAATALVAVPIPKLLKLSLDKRKHFRETSLKVLRSVGGVNVMEINGIWDKVRAEWQKKSDS